MGRVTSRCVGLGHRGKKDWTTELGRPIPSYLDRKRLNVRLISNIGLRNCRRMATTTTTTTTISSRSAVESRFDQAQFIPPDAIFALTAQFLKDPCPQKVNLGQGTYRDAHGKPWVLPSVNTARESLFAQGLHHEYLPIPGLATFREATANLVLGRELFSKHQSQVRNQIHPRCIEL